MYDYPQCWPRLQPQNASGFGTKLNNFTKCTVYQKLSKTGSQKGALNFICCTLICFGIRLIFLRLARWSVPLIGHFHLCNRNMQNSWLPIYESHMLKEKACICVYIVSKATCLKWWVPNAQGKATHILYIYIHVYIYIYMAPYFIYA